MFASLVLFFLSVGDSDNGLIVGLWEMGQQQRHKCQPVTPRSTDQERMSGHWGEED